MDNERGTMSEMDNECDTMSEMKKMEEMEEMDNERGTMSEMKKMEEMEEMDNNERGTMSEMDNERNTMSEMDKGEYYMLPFSEINWKVIKEQRESNKDNSNYPHIFWNSFNGKYYLQVKIGNEKFQIGPEKAVTKFADNQLFMNEYKNLLNSWYEPWISEEMTDILPRQRVDEIVSSIKAKEAEKKSEMDTMLAEADSTNKTEKQEIQNRL